MATLSLILMVISFVLFLLASFGVGAPRVHLGWLACAFFVLAGLLGGSPF